MQMDGRLDTLLSVLSEETYLDVESIAKKLQISERTVRMQVSQLKELLEQNGAGIERRRNLGLRIQVKERDTYQAFMKGKTSPVYPQTGRQRVEYIIALFFSSSAYIKAEELCERMCISRKTLSLDLKTVEQYLNRYHLELERKPYYGLRMCGSEFARRICLCAVFYEFRDQWIQEIQKNLKSSELVRSVILDSVKQCGYTIYEMDIPNIVLQIQIAIYRQEQGFFIRMEEITNSGFLQESDIRAARLCAEGLQNSLNITIPIPEVKYIAIQLSGKKRVLEGDKSNLVIDMEINQLVNRMLERVQEAFSVDLSSDFDLNTMLRQHMVSLRIRLQYGLRMENPILQEIKANYSFPYAVAAHASTVLSEYFHTIVPEEEIGYLALCFALSLKRQDQGRRRHNILLVCASGAGSAKLFEYRFREVFGEYLDKVETCDLASLSQKDFSYVDYVFSTIPVLVPIPVPVYEVQYFFERHNVAEVERILKHDGHTGIETYFDKTLFFTDIKGDTREQILHELCKKIGEVRRIPADFERAVLERENLMQTDLCRHIAIPHPYRPMTETTFVCVGILEKPVLWHHYEVQIVFLLSVSLQKEESLEKFYRVAPRFMMDEARMEHLIQTKSYETLLELIHWAEQEEL